ncbi:MAG TPA: T9SS type A sorting domain-containing protein [Bacteroidia bacterium]|jgi:hypothetical protein|nr:T9SS type A sorting domain-containing protein [Bacteroidia bacterium]
MIKLNPKAFFIAAGIFSGIQVFSQNTNLIVYRFDSTATLNPDRISHVSSADSAIGSALRVNPADQPAIVCSCGSVGTNDNFSSATTLTVGAAAIAGSTCGATIQAGENLDCNSSADQSVWYKFTATATTTYVVVHLDPSSNCSVGSSVYQVSALPTGSCPHATSCQSAAYGPFSSSNTVYQLTTVVGTTYYVQITYGSGGPCGNAGCFTVQATNTNPGGVTNTPPSNSCSTATSSCYFASPPTAAQITSGCTANVGSIGPNQVTCLWLQFTTQSSPGSTTTDFQAYITSNCGAGTVNWFDWTLYNSSCTSMVTCGNLNTGLSLAGLACGTSYNIEYCFETANCTWTTWYWYFNAPSSPPPCTVLPIEMLNYSGSYDNIAKGVDLNWTTATENNNDHFVIERTMDGQHYEYVGTVATLAPGGNSTSQLDYHFFDNSAPSGTVYYRLTQYNASGAVNFVGVTAVEVASESFNGLSVLPNPAATECNISFSSPVEKDYVLNVIDHTGRVVRSQTVHAADGNNSFKVEIGDLAQGMYLIQLASDGKILSGKMVRQ